jgi:hypothetical protein
MATMTIEQALDQVTAAVEHIKNDAEQRFPDAANVGDAVRQGDIYIQKIDTVTTTPLFYKPLSNVKYPMQLAPGNTQGSRHMLEESAGATVYVLDAVSPNDELANELDQELVLKTAAKLGEAVFQHARSITDESEKEAALWRSKTNMLIDNIVETLEFCGPIFNLVTEGKVSHPEHGDWILPAGSYRITFQRTIDQQLNIRRVLD